MSSSARCDKGLKRPAAPCRISSSWPRSPSESTRTKRRPTPPRRHADGYAFTIGAIGIGGRNFYNDAFTRLGYGAEVQAVAELWQAGERDPARRAVPLDLGRLTNLLGTPDALRDRLRKYRAAGLTTLLAKVEGDYAHQLATLERLLGFVAGA